MPPCVNIVIWGPEDNRGYLSADAIYLILLERPVASQAGWAGIFRSPSLQCKIYRCIAPSSVSAVASGN